MVACRLRRGTRRRCGRCQRRCPGYDTGEGRRRWRSLDAGTIRVFIEADAPRVRCPQHAVTVAAVPWARHGAGHTRAFDDQAAWLVTHTSKTAVVELMRIAWRTVGAIAARVVADARTVRDPFDGLERIGIDEISYRRGHKYLMVVVDHDTGRLVWAAEGHDRKTLQTFFDLLGPERCAKIRLVSRRRGGVDRCRRCRRLRERDAVPRPVPHLQLGVRRPRCRAALDLEPAPQARTSRPGRTVEGLPLRTVEEPRASHRPATGEAGLDRPPQLDASTGPTCSRSNCGWCSTSAALRPSPCSTCWLGWARRSRIPAFVDLYYRIKKNRAGIIASVTHGLSNGLTESVNTKLRLLTRMAYGFRSTDNLIALCLLDRGGHCPPLPGRTRAA